MPNPLSWLWDQAKRAYRKVTGGGSLSRGRLIGLRDAYSVKKAAFVTQAASGLLEGGTTVNQWLLNFRQELKTIYINQYSLARGGYNAMTQADWGSIGGQLKRQYEYMQRFADRIAAGNLSEKQIEYNMQLYFNSSTQAFERGKSASVGLMGRLPQYPGDGRTRCRANCQCQWIFEEVMDDAGNVIGINAYWTLGPAEHCVDCEINEKQWNPLFIPM